MLLANQFWDFISVLVYSLVVIVAILAFIVKKKGYGYE